MKRLLFLICVLSIVSCKQPIKAQTKIVSIKEMQELIKNKEVQLIDVRTPKEYNEGFIEKAQNINYFSPTFNSDIETLDKQKPIIVYCKKGGRSAKSAKKLQEAGFVEIYDLEGGITKWKSQGRPIKAKY